MSMGLQYVLEIISMNENHIYGATILEIISTNGNHICGRTGNLSKIGNHIGGAVINWKSIKEWKSCLWDCNTGNHI
jgi:hypothetical protein